MIYGYIRVSTDGQTTENQKLAIKNYCRERRLRHVHWVAETISGTKNPEKRKLGELIDTVEEGDTIVLTELSRLGRSLMMILNVLQKLLDKKVRVIRDIHRHARVIYENPDMFNRVKRAWAMWMLANGSFGCNLLAGFGYDKYGTTSKSLANKRNAFSESLAIRIQNTQIECCDALRIIRSRDSKETFFYLDPPYVGTFQGHYEGYSQEDFDLLLSELAKIEGKFLLSSFRNTGLNIAVEQYGWHQIELKRAKSMTAHLGKTNEKTEVLTSNYPIGIVDGDVKKL